MGALCVKPGVRMDRLGLGGAAILGALARAAVNLTFDVVITSGTDGEHSGPTDPHRMGDAFDVRSHDLGPAAKLTLLKLVMGYLAELETLAGGELLDVSDGYSTPRGCFWGFLEHPGQAGEHFHIQVRNGHTVPPIIPPLAPVMTRTA